MNSVFEYLFARRPVLNYESPPVCEANFSGTGSPVIVLDPFGGLAPVSGLVLGGVGNRTLSWNNYPGAICYSVYQADNENEPFGTYHVIAQCIPENHFQLPGRGPFRVTAITPDGETPPGDPIYGPDGAPVVTVDATTATASMDEPGVFTFYRTQPLTQPLFIKYVITGTAEAGVDYEELSGLTQIPAGLTSVEVPVNILLNNQGKTIVATVIENTNDEYIIGEPSEATVTIGCGIPWESLTWEITDQIAGSPPGISALEGQPDGSLFAQVSQISTVGPQGTLIEGAGSTDLFSAAETQANLHVEVSNGTGFQYARIVLTFDSPFPGNTDSFFDTDNIGGAVLLLMTDGIRDFPITVPEADGRVIYAYVVLVAGGANGPTGFTWDVLRLECAGE